MSSVGIPGSILILVVIGAAALLIALLVWLIVRLTSKK